MSRSSSLSIQTLFVKLPRPIRQALVTYQSVQHRMSRYGAEYRRAGAILASASTWSQDRLALLQQDLLLRLLIEAKRGTPFYAKAFAHLSDSDLLEIARNLDLQRLPLLPKATLKAATADFFNKSRRTFITSATSGSTGSPLVVEYDRESIELRVAHLHRLRGWGGIAPLERNVRMGGRLIAPTEREDRAPWLLNPFENMLLVSTYHLREPYLADIVRRIQRFAPALIEGYPTAIEQLARYCAESGVVLPSVRMVITTAETLDADMRRSIETGLGARVFDYYCASEGVPLICQCAAGAYHLFSDSGLFEFLREDGSCAASGELAELVVTSFCQWKTPLIRYRTGDLAPAPDPNDVGCPCGSTFPKIPSVLGRVEDLVITRDGRKIGMFPYRTLKYVPGMREAQIVQKSPDFLVVRVAPDGARSIDDIGRDLRHIFSQVMGYEPRVDIEVVEAIARGPNGKFRSVIREFQSAAGG